MGQILCLEKGTFLQIGAQLKISKYKVWAHSSAVVTHNPALESIVGFWWIMFVKVPNIKGKLTGHLSALRYGHYSK